ncbi:alkaline phosphatase D family protein [Candidatus Macondimonas diazotrophica]|jgi:alkaline phosphatase D|uniref:Alkaline phosphatase n=1 Tax=Candidatus Macondimonas diazotrophica TaxID=2305248 RepID=A0A4Z0F7X4_9GAMM|nr:alkaline phosphatase D family protein [Candidatus Macondimonas diazotrophica]NCU00160.1 alkaline phosphatase [Candidatus Macondimonas diazotrophica]TFZ81816.1 alkaline phosphatase [Candidatus Macondimonas diazotrophica]HBG31892.1 alkaline phosphatase [Gammaproteobacteria bacterium]HBG50251.1 alkaline phosphatase [Gammaproteobacteria bacterium]
MTCKPSFVANPSRRRLLKQAGALAGVATLGGLPLRVLGATPTGGQVAMPYGVQAGDVRFDRAIIWSRADRPARMWVEIADRPDFRGARLLRGPAALPEGDFTAKLDVAGLNPGQEVHYRVFFEDLLGEALRSEKVSGRLSVPALPGLSRLGWRARNQRGVRFVWSGDVNGQGWGINPDLGGMRIFETMRAVEPDFFIHSGDCIYADGPIQAEVALPDGSTWRNVVTPEKSKVAETLDEFRGNYRYNLMDENLRRFNAEVPIIAQWDDHEVVNNWYPGEILNDARYTETRVDLLAARGHQAFVDYMPVRFGERGRLYQSFPCGSSAEVFRIDLRSFRGPNSLNDQRRSGPEADFLGSEQLDWLMDALRRSRATWKIIASDMPIGLIVRDGTFFENGANGNDGRPAGRELEVAKLLRFIHRHRIANVVWFTADVHYTAAHYYHPDRAAFRDFSPFWEFVSGPLNAGTFGPGKLDGTFGPEVVFEKSPPAGQANLPPSAGLQFFGQVDIDAESNIMTVALKDLNGATLFEQVLEPVRGVS